MLVNYILRDMPIKCYIIYFACGEVCVIDDSNITSHVQNYIFIDKNAKNSLLQRGLLLYKNLIINSVQKLFEALDDNFGFCCKEDNIYDMTIPEIQMLYELDNFILIKEEDLKNGNIE